MDEEYKPLKIIKTADEGVKDLVFGYVRDAENVLEQDIIPPLIYHLCLIYCIQQDYFAIFNESNYNYINQQKTKITKIGKGVGTIYGSYVMKCNNESKNVYKYKFKILENYGCIIIGIDEYINNKQINLPFYLQQNTFNYSYSSYGYLCINGKLGGQEWSGDPFNENDIITMYIDCGSNKICWLKNDKQYEIIQIGNGDYRIAVYLGGSYGGTSLQLSSFFHTFEDASSWKNRNDDTDDGFDGYDEIKPL